MNEPILREGGAGVGDSTPITVHTIGHSNLTAAVFMAMLRRHEIELIADVRSAPYSKFTPHFNRDDLRYLLREAGVQYAFAGDKLGGRPPDPTCYRRGVLPEPGADYLQEVDYVAVEQRPWFQAGIRRLMELAATQQVAVLCSEGNPEQCHRHHLIARVLINQGVDVRHILADGEAVVARITPQQTDLFAALGGRE